MLSEMPTSIDHSASPRSERLAVTTVLASNRPMPSWNGMAARKGKPTPTRNRTIDTPSRATVSKIARAGIAGWSRAARIAKQAQATDRVSPVASAAIACGLEPPLE